MRNCFPFSTWSSVVPVQLAKLKNRIFGVRVSVLCAMATTRYLLLAGFVNKWIKYTSPFFFCQNLFAVKGA